MTELGDNRKAFLDMIAHSEGTSTIEGSDNGYNVLVGGTLFDSYADHPRKLVTINSKLKSTAAGRYQLLSRYFDYYKKLLHLPDFSPASQDAIALQQIRECRALQDVDDGKIQSAINKCKGIWASLPGAGYGQRENNLDDLLIAYQNAGGTVA
jgi:muramidase (phage lysozyme)